MNISIVIPVHNGGDKFRQCLESVKVCMDAQTELIVVADGETDGAWRMAPAFGAQVIRMPVSNGAARARNAGAAAASGDILFFIDADVTLPPDAIGRIRTTMGADPGISAIIGSYDDAPGEPNFLSQYRNLLHHYVHQQANEDASTFWGACGAIRRSVFQAAGGFDPDYAGATIEDIELGYRLKRMGHRIRMQKELQVKHLKHWGIASVLRTDIFCRALPWTRLILQNAELIDDLNLKRRDRFSLILAYLLLFVILCTFVAPRLFAAAVPTAGLLIWLNRDLYAFFARKKGFGFSVCAVFWHWLYFLYSGLGFALGLAESLRRKPADNSK